MSETHPTRGRVLVTVCVVLSQLLSARAHADPDGYRTAVDEAVAEFSAHRFEESRSLFARAHALFPNARTLRGLGLADFELRNYAQCVRQLEAALGSTVRPLDGELRDDTESLLTRARHFVARYTLLTHPEALRLTVDGVETKLHVLEPLLLSLGPHTLELHTSGYEPERVALQVSGGETQTLEIRFSRPLALRSSSNRPTDNDPSPRRSSWYESPWPWAVLGGVLVAGAVTAIVLSTSGHKNEPVLGGSTGVVIQGS